MKYLKFLYILFLLIFINSFTLKCQPTQINISGFVKDAITGEALIGANILIYKDTIDINSPPFSGAATNSYGFYVIPKIPKAVYILITRYIGYKTVIREVDAKIKQETVTIKY